MSIFQPVSKIIGQAPMLLEKLVKVRVGHPLFVAYIASILPQRLGQRVKILWW